VQVLALFPHDWVYPVLQSKLSPELDIHKLVVDKLSMGERVDYIICDEAQFHESAQIDQLARVVDGLGIDVFAFGILADFKQSCFRVLLV